MQAEQVPLGIQGKAFSGFWRVASLGSTSQPKGSFFLSPSSLSGPWDHTAPTWVICTCPGQLICNLNHSAM